MSSYILNMPQVVFSGENALDKINLILSQNNVKRLAFITDKGIVKAGLAQKVIALVEKSGIPYIMLDNIPSEPSYLEVQKQADLCRSFRSDFIIGLGGGSVMDTAKIASVLMGGRYGVRELLDTPTMAKKQVRTLMIPSTAGTGSEATPNAIVSVPERQLKIGIVNEDMIADYVILDAEMIKDLPRHIAAATGVDALAHAVECWTGNKANPFSDMFAMQALEMILESIKPACDKREAIEAKRRMQMASFYAGVAISSSGTTAVHALSYPLGGKYHISHGISNAMLLVPVMRFNEQACRPRLAAIYDRCLKGNETTQEGKSAAVIQRLDDIVKHLDIPTSLSAFGVPKEDLEDLVASGMEVTRLLQNNRRKITPDDARKIYMEIL